MTISAQTAIQATTSGLRASESGFGSTPFGVVEFAQFNPGPIIGLSAVVGSSAVTEVPVNTTVTFTANCTDEYGSFFSPLNGAMQIKIIDPSSTLAPDWTSMTPNGVGKFTYAKTIPLAGPTGTWGIKVRAQTNTTITTNYPYIFSTMRLKVTA